MERVGTSARPNDRGLGVFGTVALGLACGLLAAGVGWASGLLGQSNPNLAVVFIVPAGGLGYFAGRMSSRLDPDPWYVVPGLTAVAAIAASGVVLFEMTFLATSDPLVFLATFLMGGRWLESGTD
ncbi:hypothetical protein EG829_22180 [bacterium]|nr:hypothetical protein [bacterium]